MFSRIINASSTTNMSIRSAIFTGTIKTSSSSDQSLAELQRKAPRSGLNLFGVLYRFIGEHSY